MSQTLSPLTAHGREPFAAFVCEDAALDVLHPVVVELGWRPDACHKGGLRAAMRELSVSSSPAILLVDLSESTDALAEIDSLAEVCEPGTIVIATGRVNDVALYRALLARGVHDYLPKPVSADQLREALSGAQAHLLAPREIADDRGETHVSAAVVGTRGGAGASMLATSLAWLLGSEHGKSTALLDLDVHFGTGALTFDLEPGRGLTDAIEDPSRIDGLFIERAMVRTGDRLALMSAETPINTPLQTDGSAFLRLEAEFRQGFEATIIDLPRNIMINFPHLLAEVNNVIVVGELTLASARDTIRILSWLKASAPAARPIVVANKVHPGASEISETDFAAAIERKVDFAIPFDHKAAIKGARLGQTFAEANRGTKAVAPLNAIARALASADALPGEVEAAGRPASLLDRFDLKALLARKGRASSEAAA